MCSVRCDKHLRFLFWKLFINTLILEDGSFQTCHPFQVPTACAAHMSLTSTKQCPLCHFSGNTWLSDSVLEFPLQVDVCA